jgi:2-polyprenyl-3-methyl-5-hydroxy-6-metoxy-1,4-benzoquinol methylase
VTCNCGLVYERYRGIHDFFGEPRRAAAQAFSRQYRRVRASDGHQQLIARFWHELPDVPKAQDPGHEWHVRRESYNRFVALVLRVGPQRVLDLGAGCGWLSSRLARQGHDVVALDRLDDDADGALLARQDRPPFVAVRGDFEALPFEPGQFDVVVFNASLHYARQAEDVLGRAAQMLKPRGTLVVMDSPTFVRSSDGESMVATQMAAVGAVHDLADVVRPGIGYLTFANLDRAAERLRRQASFYPSHGPLAWRLRRPLARRQLGREPATFGVWVAR